MGVAYANKSVTLTVDGTTSAVTVLGSDVGDLLDKQGIALGAHDVVVPSVESELSDGDAISVRYGRKLTVKTDGVSAEHWTTATTLDQALADLNVRTEGAKLSVSRSAPLGRDGLTLEVITPKPISLVVAGKKSATTTVGATVAEVLTESKIAVGKSDRVTPAVTTAITKGLTITVKRVVEKSVTKTVSVPFTTTKKKDSSLYVGQSKTVTAGKAGSKKVTEKQIIVDGKLESSTVTKTVEVQAPITEVVSVGSKAAPKPSASSGSSGSTPSAGNTSGAGLNLANAAMWDRIAQCESTGNWSINTGNGYYGGLQFSSSTWLSTGGGDFAPRADLASRAEQITVANRLYARAGLQPWGCAHAA